MIQLKSKSLCSYYGEYPNDYYIKFIHHDFNIIEESPLEYKKIEEDLESMYNYDSTSFLIYFSNVDNYIKFKNNISFNENIYLRINSIEDYKKINNDNLKLIIDIKDIDKFEINNNIVIQLDRINELDKTRLDELMSKYNIKEILLGQIPYLSKEDNYIYDIMSKMYNIDSSKKIELEKMNKITNDLYTVDEFIEILDKFNNIIDNLNIKDKKDGLFKIFDHITNEVVYDDEGVKETKITNQNLIGPVLNNIGVCEGYSKYLTQLLSLIGIESIVVQGGNLKEDGGHVWNQVLFDKTWYNADVTAASYSIKHNQEVKTRFVKDSNLLYKTYSSISHDCKEDL